MSQQLALLMIVLPVVGAVLCGTIMKGCRHVAVGCSAGVLGLAVWTVTAGFGASSRLMFGRLPWLTAMSNEPLFGIMIDPLSALMLVLVTTIGFLTVLYSTQYLTERHKEHPVPAGEHGRYYFWLLLFLASMVGVSVSPNFLQLLLFWELTTVCSWALISFHRNARSLRAGFKALVMTHAGGLFFLVAICILFARGHSFDFSAIAALPEGLRAWVFVCLMIAAWAKAAQVPLHTWLPDAMEAPTPISAYLHAAAMVKAGVYLMARSAGAGWAMPPHVALVLAIMAMVTIAIALSFYFVQDDLKRLLAFSTIAHLGYILLGVGIGSLGSVLAYRGGVLHIICHGFSKATLFFCAGAVAYVTGSRSISAIRGLGRSMPLSATAFFVGVLAVAGVPPFACFWSKFMILAGAMQLSGPIGPIVLVFILVETLVSFAWLLYVAQRVFMGTPSPVATVNSDPPPAMSVTLVILMVGCLLAPAIGIPLVELIGR
ncbi:MAG: hydrogenase 4 subunit D [Acidobacteriota bacterium]